MAGDKVGAHPDAHIQSHPTEADWCGLHWTPWRPLERNAIREMAPTRPGVYRVRRQGVRTGRLVYIGQTGRTLRERLLSLAAGANAAECPFNDPHTAAPYLWLLRHNANADLDFSCAIVEGDAQTRHGTEDMLLWRHRVETGHSAEANYGRFFPGYSRPTNRWVVRGGTLKTRTPGRRAEPLTDLGPVDFSTSHPALTNPGALLDAPWWRFTALDDFRSLPHGPAVYAIHERGSTEPVYIGETSSLPDRAASHMKASWQMRAPAIAFMLQPAGTPKHVLRELESDLLGWHFFLAGRAPALQYVNGPRQESEATVASRAADCGAGGAPDAELLK